MKRLPLIPTIVVGAACVLMVWLGFWQLRRADEKAALLALYAQNLKMSGDVDFPAMPPVSDAKLFRHSQVMCLAPVSWVALAGMNQAGKHGYRYFTSCKTGAEGPGFLADMGVSTDPHLKPAWKGGEIAGMITTDPRGGSLFSKMFGKEPARLPMLVADKSPAGLEPSTKPRIEDVPNNHMAYAVQWFIFATLAALIYLLALRRRKDGA